MRILVCAAVCAVALTMGAKPAWAQDPAVSAGVKVGVTSATIAVTGFPGFEPERRAGLLGGAFISFGGQKVRVQPEVMVTTRKFVSASPGGDIEVASRTVDVPLLLVGRFRSESRAHPILFAGPYLAFISKTTQTVGGVETDIDSQIKGTDAGLVFGVGLEVDGARGAFVMEARYALGLKDVAEASAITFKSRTLMASVGYRF
jgi:hypothetical protein